MSAIDGILGHVVQHSGGKEVQSLPRCMLGHVVLHGGGAKSARCTVKEVDGMLARHGGA